MKKKKLELWCPICEKWRKSHQTLSGKIIHERDDCPNGMLYFVTESSVDRITKN